MTSARFPALLTVLALLVTVHGVAAQTVPPPGTSAEEVQRQITNSGLRSTLLQRIEASGLSPDQVRQRLASMGYDPSTLDPYLDEEFDLPDPGMPSGGALSAAEALGLLDPDSIPTDSAATMTRAEADSIAMERERGLRVFGLDVFRRATTEFQSVTTGPVPPDYRVGPGDELVLILTGDVEAFYDLHVTREGFIVIPQVGQVWVNGLTMDEIRDQLYTRLGRSYSGVQRGPEATTRFQLTLGQLRPNQVFVAGQVAEPGSYVVSAVASALNALYLGGGPTPNGSFRDVRINRAGELAHRLDLYEYLLRGDNLSDINLEPGDVVFVPVHRTHVSIDGEVARPAIYEVLPGETLADLVAFAGGLNAPAQLRRARIERILPPGERTAPGVDRVVIDVDLAAALDDPAAAPTLEPGDAVTIFPVRPELRRTVRIQGAVWGDMPEAKPAVDRAGADSSAWRTWRTGRRLPAADSARNGQAHNRPDQAQPSMASPQPPRDDRDVERRNTYRYYQGMRLWDLIDLAGGLRDDAYTRRAQIVRVDPQDSTLTMIPTTLETDADGLPVANPELREFDAVRVFRKSDFTTDFPVTLTGDVRNPMDTVFEEGTTLRDLILRGGGLNPTADLTVEIARLPEATRRGSDTIAEIIHVTVDSTFLVSDQAQEFYLGQIAEAEGRAAEFELHPYDRVTVRALPDFELQRAVEVRGHVSQPGHYTLMRKNERLSTVIGRAGGLRSEAYAGGARLYREGVRVNVDLERALAEPGGTADIVLLRDDSLYVPEYNPVVTIRGAVNGESPLAIQYRSGAGLDYYIENAGGYARNADAGRVNIRYANGEGATVGRFLVFRRAPEPRPGAVITVPFVRDEDRIDAAALIGDIAQIAATLTTIALVIARL